VYALDEYQQKVVSLRGSPPKDIGVTASAYVYRLGSMATALEAVAIEAERMGVKLSDVAANSIHRLQEVQHESRPE
jgi:hypothetical protein